MNENPSDKIQTRAKMMTNKESFLARAKATHGDGKYEYPFETWPGSRKVVDIKCLAHKIVFQQTPRDHVDGKHKCEMCAELYNKCCKTSSVRKIEILEKKFGDGFVVIEIDDDKPIKEMMVTILCHSCSEKELDYKDCITVKSYHDWINAKHGHKCKINESMKEAALNKETLGPDHNLAVKFPHIAAEWSKANTIDGKFIDPSTIYPKARESYWWICPEGHDDFSAPVSRRTSFESSCPVCSGHKLHPDNSFATVKDCHWLHPTLNDKKAHEYPRGGNDKVWFVCDCVDASGNRLEHTFEAPLYSFYEGHRCPYKYGRACDIHNSIYTKVPEVDKFWNMNKNEKSSTEVTYGSGQLFWFICPKCSHEWQTQPNRIIASDYEFDCPNCRPRNSSKISLMWLKSVMDETGINIQHDGNGGEFNIPGTGYKADGYDPITNTVYEFHGTYWHGDPRMYEPHILCPFGSEVKTFGEVYNATIRREEHIKSLGYNLVAMWELDFKEKRKRNGI